MVSTWNSGATLPQPGYRSMFTEETSREGLTFVDFLPEVQSPGGIFKKAVYEVFRSLVDRANDWLRANPQWEIKTCESVEFKDKGNSIDSEKMIYLEYGDVQTWYIRGLRLWISSRKDDDERNQQIGYLNIVPQETEQGGMFSSPVYEKLDDVVNKFNQMIRTRPIPGRIITIESQEMKVSSDGVNPDKSSWVENGSRVTKFVYVLRVFYEITESNSEEIGIQDFIPSIIKRGGVFTLPTYEMFSYIVDKASEWCSQRTDIRICNAQTLEIKMTRGSEIDTQKMNYVEHGSRATFYVRILRVAYTKPVTHSNPALSPSITRLTCKTFVPVQISSGLFIPDFETLKETKTRVSAWMKATGAQVISAQTSAVKVSFMGGGTKYIPESTFTYKKGERNEFYLYIIRVYLNGYYPEPPEGTLPPIPDLNEWKCLIS